MTGKQKQDDITLEEVIEEVKDHTQEDEVSVETDNDEATAEITIESLAEQIETLKTQVADNLDKAVRAQAELDNVRKRTTRDVENAHKYALKGFVEKLLPVIDSMEMGQIAAISENATLESIREGSELTVNMFTQVLERSGLQPINPLGEKFDPERHQAISMVEIKDAESNSVIEVMQKGFLLNDRLIRPAMVVVAK